MKYKICLWLAAAILLFSCQTNPSACFAVIADTHVNSHRPQSVAELKEIIADINAQDSIEFVILAGDITEFGSDEEIAMAYEVLQQFEKPWYVLSGNHDSKWSESGCNTF